MTKIAFPGTFDPITRGHESLIDRVSLLFDEVVVCISASTHKKTLLPIDIRHQLITESTKNHRNVTVNTFDTLLIQFLDKIDCNLVLRGVRTVADFEFEMQLATINKKMAPSIETILLLPDRDYFHLSSSMIREICALGGEIDKFVSPHVAACMRQYTDGPNH